MSKISEQAAKSFLISKQFKKDNTEVKMYSLIGEYALFLHGNRIAWWDRGKIYISNRGFFTKTTKDRLNQLPNVHIVQKRGEWYLNGIKWDGFPVCVDSIGKTDDLIIDGDL